MKFRRHNRIIELVEENNIETQEELIEKLRESGFDVTQATVSRDIKELGLVKITTKDNTYKYALPGITGQDSPRVSNKFRNILRETVMKVDFAGNIVVFKTYPGMAQAAAAAIDGLGWREIVGSLAGDDTIFVLLRNTDKAQEFAVDFKESLTNYKI